MPHLKAVFVHIFDIGLPDITFCTYVYNYALLLRGPYARLVYVLNMSSPLKTRHYKLNSPKKSIFINMPNPYL